jgi:hypothetical protein
VSTARGHGIIYSSGGPPENELPAVLETPSVIWHGDGTVLAVPSLWVYTTGAEMLILYRARQAQSREIDNARLVSDTLPRGLRVNGRAVTLLDGEFLDHGFRYRAWVPFVTGERDLVFTLEWAGVEAGERRVAGVGEAAGRAVVLWDLG